MPPLSLCPGKKNLVPVSLCPGTRAGAKIPGQTLLSRDVPGQNEIKVFKNKTRFSVLEVLFLFFGYFWKSDFVPGRPGTEEFVPGHLFLPLSCDKGTPGQDFFLSRDKGRTGRPVQWTPYYRPTLIKSRISM